MQIKAEWSGNTLVIKNQDRGLVFVSDSWPQDVMEVEDFLRSLCGEPVEGFYVWHESRGWLKRCLESAASISREQLGALAIRDLGGIDTWDAVPSKVRAAALAVMLIGAESGVSIEESRMVVHLNICSKKSLEVKPKVKSKR